MSTFQIDQWVLYQHDPSTTPIPYKIFKIEGDTVSFHCLKNYRMELSKCQHFDASIPMEMDAPYMVPEVGDHLGQNLLMTHNVRQNLLRDMRRQARANPRYAICGMR